MGLYSLDPIHFQEADHQLAERERRREWGWLHGDGEMSDDETRQEEYRIEAIIERNLLNGTWGKCFICGDPTPYREQCIIEDYYNRWCCSYCRRMMDNPGD